MVQKIKIYNPFTQKESKVDPYGRTAKKIYKYLIDTGSDANSVLPDNLTYNNGRFIRVKPVIDVSNVRRITYQTVRGAVGDQESTMPYFRKMMKSYAGQTIKLVKRFPEGEADIDDDGKASFSVIEMNEISETVSIPKVNSGFSKWWEKNSFFFWLDSIVELFGDYNSLIDDPKLQAQLLILTLDKVKKEKFDQYFLDGINHCFFHPIMTWASNCEAEAKSKTAQSRYKTIQKKCSKYLNEFSSGVPENELSNICNDLQISVEIDLPSTLRDDETYIEVESQKKALKKFRFINTRINHIELNEITNKDTYTECNRETLKKLYDECIKNKQFILWKESKAGITEVRDLHQIYRLKDDSSYAEAVKNFEEEYGFNNYRIEKNSNEDLTVFLDDGLNCNQSMTFYPEEFEDEPEKWVDGLGPLNHIDMRKAYTQGHKCSMYQGYLGKITDFRKTDKIEGLGIYQVCNIKFNGCSAIENMKCFHNFQNYPSPELEFYKKLGITFDITAGCWGSSFDMEFPKYMYEQENGLSHYKKWYGCLMRTNSVDRYNFCCDNIEFAQLNAYDSKNCIRYNYDQKTGIVEYKKKYQYHQYQIASFICSYSRISVLEQVLKFKDFNQIISVVVDGIYFKGDVEVNPLFSEKEQKSIKHNMDSEEYVFDYHIEEDDIDEEYAEYRVNNKVEIHLGAGGCGKTHNNLIDKGFVNPLFIAPSWKLARNKKQEYGVESTTFHHVLTSDPDVWRKFYRSFSVFIVDEISMFSHEGRIDLMKRYPEHKIIFCGDVGYQLPPIEGSVFDVDCGLPVFHHTKNYRCECPELAKHLMYMRRLIGDSKIPTIDSEKLVKRMGYEIVDSNSIDYGVEDMILCSTHNQKNKYTERFKHLEKYSVLENSRDYSNGDIIIGSKPEKVRCELRHAFTVHSIQGETAKNKLFIDLDRFRSMKMLYTAMSRAKRKEQIVFIK
tara:strand:+ start:3136 stop:5991 length:2856 start_codon:yes stop_codon:yes gene_type:complete